MAVNHGRNARAMSITGVGGTQMENRPEHASQPSCIHNTLDRVAFAYFRLFNRLDRRRDLNASVLRLAPRGRVSRR